MKWKKKYQLNELADLFNVNRRQIYRLIENNYLKKFSNTKSQGSFISGNSVKKYTEKYINNCNLPVYTANQIFQKTYIPIRKIYALINSGNLHYIKVNPDSKRNKTIRIPFTAHNKNIFTYHCGEYSPTFPILISISGAADILNISKYKLKNLIYNENISYCDSNYGKKGKKIYIPSLLIYLIENGHSRLDIERRLAKYCQPDHNRIKSSGKDNVYKFTLKQYVLFLTNMGDMSICPSCLNLVPENK